MDTDEFAATEASYEADDDYRSAQPSVLGVILVGLVAVIAVFVFVSLTVG